MAKDKYDFIREILNNHNLSFAQRERILLLTSEEIIIDKQLGKVLEERVDRLEEKLGLKVNLVDRGLLDITLKLEDNNRINADSNLNNSKFETPILKNIEVKKHFPRGMVKFLFIFSIDENFKWFTHKPDDAIDKINISEKLKDFDKNLKALNLTWNLNLATYFFIHNFFKNESKGLSIQYPIEYSTNLNFANQQIRKKIESEISPYDIEIDNEYFSKTIQLFKNSIEFRLDNKECKFEKVFRNFITSNLSIDFNEKYSDSFDGIAKSLTAYIDVNNFYRGLKVIIGWLNDYKALSNQVFIDLQNEEDYYILVIFHKNSYFQTDPFSSKFSGTAGNFGISRKYWFSIVDWVIDADCVYDGKTEAYNFICLNEYTELVKTELTPNRIEKKNSIVGGVRHLIKIFKTKDL